jgi:class 3 adenylate cyclase
MTNDGRLSQRHDQNILDDLKRVSDESGISQVALVAASVRGLTKTWDEQKELTFPFRVIPESLYRSFTAKKK